MWITDDAFILIVDNAVSINVFKIKITRLQGCCRGCRWSHLIVILLRRDSQDLKSVKHTNWAAFLRNVRMVRPFGAIGDNGGSTPQIQHLVSIHVDVSTKSQIPILVANESRVKLQIEPFVLHFTVGQIGKNSGCSRYSGNGLIKQEVRSEEH